MTRAPQRILDTAFVTLHTPWSVGLSFLALEITVVICGALAFLHALRAHRRGEALPLFTWGVSFTYGLLMEIGSYNFVKSFAHGQFSVMFYHHQLPLYVVTLYPVLQYTSIMAARRLRLGLAAECFAAGALIVSMDMPFDILGPVNGWWSWSGNDPNTAFRWHGVPVTSYYWHLAWGGLLAGVTRVASRWATRPARMIGLALPLALLTIVLGVISFVPFHVLKARGVEDGTIVVGLFVVSVVISVTAARKAPAVAASAGDRPLFTIPAAYFGVHLLVALAGLAADPRGFGGRMAVIAAIAREGA